MVSACPAEHVAEPSASIIAMYSSALFARESTVPSRTSDTATTVWAPRISHVLAPSGSTICGGLLQKAP
jgi:hypothetical protein